MAHTTVGRPGENLSTSRSRSSPTAFLLKSSEQIVQPMSISTGSSQVRSMGRYKITSENLLLVKTGCNLLSYNLGLDLFAGHFLSFIFFIESGSHYLSQSSYLLIFPSLSPKCWDCIFVSQYVSLLKLSFYYVLSLISSKYP